MAHRRGARRRRTTRARVRRSRTRLYTWLYICAQAGAQASKRAPVPSARRYPRTDTFPGAAEHCVHNSNVRSWAGLAAEGAERVVIGGYESGMDATVHLAKNGAKVRVLASTPFWEQRTLDPSTELAPFTAMRLREAQQGEFPPELTGNCRVTRVEKDEENGGYVVHAERTVKEQAAAPAKPTVKASAPAKQKTGATQTLVKTERERLGSQIHQTLGGPWLAGVSSACACTADSAFRKIEVSVFLPWPPQAPRCSQCARSKSLCSQPASRAA